MEPHCNPTTALITHWLSQASGDNLCIVHLPQGTISVLVNGHLLLSCHSLEMTGQGPRVCRERAACEPESRALTIAAAGGPSSLWQTPESRVSSPSRFSFLSSLGHNSRVCLLHTCSCSLTIPPVSSNSSLPVPRKQGVLQVSTTSQQGVTGSFYISSAASLGAAT